MALSTKATKGLDRKYVQYLIELEAQVNKELDLLSSDLQKALKKASKSGKVTKVKQFNKASAVIVDKYFDTYEITVSEASGTIASHKAGLQVNQMKPIFAKLEFNTPIERMEAKVAGYNAYYQKELLTRRVPALGNYTFTERIKSLKKGTTTVVRSIVHNGVKDGLSAKEMAKQIDTYVKPTGKQRVRPLDVVRKRLGRPKTYTPTRLPVGSVQYNSIMIARTESAFTYRQSTVDFYKTETWIKGYRWVLSGSHTKRDICNTWATHGLYKKDGSDLPSGHPNCLCDVHAIRYSNAELKKMGNN